MLLLLFHLPGLHGFCDFKETRDEIREACLERRARNRKQSYGNHF